MIRYSAGSLRNTDLSFLLREYTEERRVILRERKRGEAKGREKKKKKKIRKTKSRDDGP